MSGTGLTVNSQQIFQNPDKNGQKYLGLDKRFGMWTGNAAEKKEVGNICSQNSEQFMDMNINIKRNIFNFLGK